MSFPDSEKESAARGLVIPDNRAIKNIKGSAEAKSKSEREARFLLTLHFSSPFSVVCQNKKKRKSFTIPIWT